MQLGFLTNSWGDAPIGAIASWAKSHGFTALEIGPRIALDIGEIEQALRGNGLGVIGFIYCRNLMSSDQAEREMHRRNLKARIDAASQLGAPYVTTSTGVDQTKSINQNFQDVVAYFTELVSYASSKGVTVCLENCPDMSNLAHSPARWQRLFAELGDTQHLKLCLDPSHLLRLFIDPYLAAESFGQHTAYIHAKDTQVHPHRLARMGILEPHGWWEYRLPGMGELNWSKFLSVLMQKGFTGPISIEHEDPIWSGTREKVQAGLLKGKAYLESLLR